jgi:transcriptional regulator with XRE-family HTH domain
MTQQVVADLCGVSAAYLSMVENGKREAGRYSLLLDLAAALQVPPAELAPGLRDRPDEPAEALRRPASELRLCSDWQTDPMADLADLGSTDLHADPERRHVLTAAAYSAAAAALPDPAWWQSQAATPAQRPARSRQRLGPADVATVQQLGIAFSRLDQLRGGGHGRKAVVQYLRSDAATLLNGSFVTDEVRRGMFAAVGELAYLSGWMAFDNDEHALADRYYRIALKLAARAGDPPLAGHILRAMAHQALDLGLPRPGLELAAASVQGQRYLSAGPRERALLGVVHARALARAGDKQAATRALLRAEDDLSASGDTAGPARVFFFGEASLAHETGRALQDCGDLSAAIRHFQHSIKTRGTAFRRTHIVTLGYLASAQLASGQAEDASVTWSQALDLLEDGAISSGRARQAIRDMRRLTSRAPDRQPGAVTQLHERTKALSLDT